MNILLACGGSGGHIAPAIAVAERLTDHHCTFVLSQNKVDSFFAKKYAQFEFIHVSAMPFRLSPIAFARFCRSQLTSFRYALKLLTQRHIKLVISFGGFTSLGFVLAAKFKKIPIILHESNQIPGKSTRVLAKFADKILLPPGVTIKHQQKKIISLDYPIRKEFKTISKEEARKIIGWPVLKKIILVIGGSNGALALTKWAEQNFTKFAHYNTDIFCIAGPVLSQERAVNYEDCTLHMLPFCEEMNLAICASDLVVSRAGAGTIAECRYHKRPMFLVPYPFAADNHQLANAKAAEKLGIATVCEQNEIDTLTQKLLEVIKFPSNLNSKMHAMATNPISDAAEQFSVLVESMLHQ